MKISVDGKTVFINQPAQALIPSQPTWVFIHGAAMDHSVWNNCHAQLTNIKANVLAIDLPGHGQSQGKAINQITAIADWLQLVFQALNLKQAIITGHSMGALVSYDFAARHAQYCQGLVLLGFSLPMPVNQQLLALSKANDPRAFEMIVEYAYAKSSKLKTDPATPDLRLTESTLRLLKRSRADTLYHDFTACNQYSADFDYQIDCPTLFVCGDADKMTPARNIQSWTTQIPQSQIETIKDCGHMMMTEQPESVITALDQFHQQLKSNKFV